MNREIISEKQGICLLTLFIVNGTVMLPTAVEAKNDLWIAIILSMFFATPMVIIYSKLISFFPRKNIYEILEYIFGKFIGKIISMLYIWFAFHLGSIILRDFGVFISTVTLPETPQIIMIIIPGFLCILTLKVGLEVLGRFSYLFTIFLIVSILIFGSLMIPILDINNLKPILGNGIKPVLMGAFSAFSFPFAETILFTAILPSLRKKQSVLKVYLLGLLIGGLTILFTNTFDLLVQGINSYSGRYFPGYVTVNRVNLGGVLQRVEIIGALIFTVGSFVKLCICMFVVVKGISKVFNFKSYIFLLLQLFYYLFV